jgi:glycine/D-amino acid oxidase-like deaminating enzyme
MSRPAGRSADVAIIGGGIVGTATATFLARAGARVTLYERNAIAAGASGRNSGVIQQPHDPVLAALYRESLAAYRALDGVSNGALGLGPGPVGLLHVGTDRGVVEAIAEAWRAADPLTRPEVLAGPELRRLEPALAGDLVACRVAIGYPVAPAAATLAFAAAAEHAGATIAIVREARPALRHGVAVGVEVGGVVHAAGAVIVAAGPWTPAILDPVGGWRPIRPIWGVVVELALPAPPRHVMEEAGIDIEPDGGGDDIAGSSAPDGIEFSLVTAAGATSLGSSFTAAEPRPADLVDAIRAHGSRFVPGLADAPSVAVRACARPVSLDGRPLVGAVPWIDNLYMAAGNGPWGISTGPATARLIADLVLGTGAPVPATLDVERFGHPDRDGEAA